MSIIIKRRVVVEHITHERALEYSSQNACATGNEASGLAGMITRALFEKHLDALYRACRSTGNGITVELSVTIRDESGEAYATEDNSGELTVTRTGADV